MALQHTLKGTNINLTSEHKSRVEEKMAQLEKLIDPNDESALADVELERTTNHHQKGEIFRAEINLHIAGAHLRAEETSEDIFVALDGAKDDMLRRLRKEKTKRKDKAKTKISI